MKCQLFFTDVMNFNVIILPPKNLILKSDRYTLKQAAAMTILENQQK